MITDFLVKMLSLFKPINELAGRSIMWLNAEQKGALLDIGCGSGDFLADMQEFGWDVFGVEPDEKAAEIAREKVEPKRIFIGPLEKAAFKDNQFNIITLIHVIEHVEDPIKMLKECYRVLHPGGKVIVATPNFNGLGSKYFKKNWRGWEPPRHLFIFNKKTLSQCALNSGLSNFTVTTNATIAYDISLFNDQFKNNTIFFDESTQFHQKYYIIKALCFWIFQYLSNLIKPCGDELVLTATK